MSDASQQSNYNSAISYKSYKIVLLGDAGVGKSSIVRRFIYNSFDSNESSTLGSCFHIKELLIDKLTIKISLWDTAGEEKYSSLAHLYYHDCQAALVVFDCNKFSTFARAKLWIQELRENTDNKTQIWLIANKIDCEKREIDTEEGKKFAESEQLFYDEVSAKSGKNIENLFVNISKILSEDKKIKKRHKKIRDSVKLKSGQQISEKSKKCSC